MRIVGSDLIWEGICDHCPLSSLHSCTNKRLKSSATVPIPKQCRHGHSKHTFEADMSFMPAAAYTVEQCPPLTVGQCPPLPMQMRNVSCNTAQP